MLLEVRTAVLPVITGNESPPRRRVERLGLGCATKIYLEKIVIVPDQCLDPASFSCDVVTPLRRHKISVVGMSPEVLPLPMLRRTKETVYPRRLTHFSAIAAVTALTGALTLGLAANEAMATTATFNVSGGTLGISAPTNTVALTDVKTSLQAQTVTGVLGAVTVTDTRGGGVTTWTTTVSSTAFNTIAATNVNYQALTPGNLSQVGTGTYAAYDLTDISTPKTAVAASSLSGNTSATWTPTISVTVPANTPVGTYTGTITHSVV